MHKVNYVFASNEWTNLVSYKYKLKISSLIIAQTPKQKKKKKKKGKRKENSRDVIQRALPHPVTACRPAKLQSGRATSSPRSFSSPLLLFVHLFLFYSSNRQAGVRQFQRVFPVSPSWHLLPSGCWHRAAAVISKHEPKTRPTEAVQQSYLPGTCRIYRAYKWSGRIAESQCELGEC